MDVKSDWSLLLQKCNRHVVDWMAFIDIDEFIDPNPGKSASFVDEIQREQKLSLNLINVLHSNCTSSISGTTLWDSDMRSHEREVEAGKL